MPDLLDIAANRSARKYSRKEMFQRVLWIVGSWVFRLSPRPCHRWRCLILRCFGARIGKHVHLYSSTFVTMPWNLTIGNWSSIGEHALVYNLGKVTIGERATISQRSHLCAGTHNYSMPDFPLLKLPIDIEDNVWICADAFIGPGVTIKKGAIVGARAVATKDVEPWTIVVGNPARKVKDRKLVNESKQGNHSENTK